MRVEHGTDTSRWTSSACTVQLPLLYACGTPMPADEKAHPAQISYLCTEGYSEGDEHKSAPATLWSAKQDSWAPRQITHQPRLQATFQRNPCPEHPGWPNLSRRYCGILTLDNQSSRRCMPSKDYPKTPTAKKQIITTSIILIVCVLGFFALNFDLGFSVDTRRFLNRAGGYIILTGGLLGGFGFLWNKKTE